jgi:hypothetical protein
MTIDLTPTWGEWGNVYRRFAETGERQAVMALREDFAKAMASCAALKGILDTLNADQAATVSNIMVTELRKQGF